MKWKNLIEKANNSPNMIPSDLDLTFSKKCLYLQVFFQELKKFVKRRKNHSWKYKCLVLNPTDFCDIFHFTLKR